MCGRTRVVFSVLIWLYVWQHLTPDRPSLGLLVASPTTFSSNALDGAFLACTRGFCFSALPLNVSPSQDSFLRPQPSLGPWSKIIPPTSKTFIAMVPMLVCWSCRIYYKLGHLKQRKVILSPFGSQQGHKPSTSSGENLFLASLSQLLVFLATFGIPQLMEASHQPLPRLCLCLCLHVLFPLCLSSLSLGLL